MPRGARGVATHATRSKEPSVFADTALLKLAARFLVCFAALFAAIVWLNVRTPFVTDVEAATAAAATLLMNLTGVVATRTGILISVPGRQLSIGPDCTGITIAAMLVSLVVAYPVKTSSKALGVLAGILAIVVANLVRLVVVAHLSGAPDALFYAMHDFLFQVGMVAVAIAVWAGWLVLVRAHES